MKTLIMRLSEREKQLRRECEQRAAQIRAEKELTLREVLASGNYFISPALVVENGKRTTRGYEVVCCETGKTFEP